MLTKPLREPSVVGLNVTLTAQLAPAATVVPQVLVWAKSPVTWILDICSSAVPDELSIVIDCGLLTLFKTWLPNVKLVAERIPAGVPPAPVRLTILGLPTALSVTKAWPVKLATALGVNPKLKVQLAAGASTAGQLFVCEKPVPVKAMLLMVRGALPRFVSTAGCVG